MAHDLNARDFSRLSESDQWVIKKLRQANVPVHRLHDLAIAREHSGTGLLKLAVRNGLIDEQTAQRIHKKKRRTIVLKQARLRQKRYRRWRRLESTADKQVVAFLSIAAAVLFIPGVLMGLWFYSSEGWLSALGFAMAGLGFVLLLAAASGTRGGYASGSLGDGALGFLNLFGGSGGDGGGGGGDGGGGGA